ncbi:MAG: hypothetical protein HYS76_01305 [Candidatus Wildermuthbacteria bacterium]|nr:hypothetical protein [Candidatus Wildermuthbacteria bacterium]
MDQVAEEAVLLAEETEEEKDREGWLAVLMAWPAEMEMIALAERTASALALALAGALEFRSGSAEVAAEAEAGLSVLLRFWVAEEVSPDLSRQYGCCMLLRRCRFRTVPRMPHSLC